MQGIMRYSGCLLVGIAIGYGFAQLQQQQPALSVSGVEYQPPAPVLGAVAPVNVAEPTEVVAEAPKPPADNKHQPVVESPTITDPARQQSTVDENWLSFVEQQYPKRLQQELSVFPDHIKQQMQAFQQTEVDTDWAQATEQQLQDLLITDKELQPLQVERVQCRQNGCEIFGTSLNPAGLDALNRQLRRFEPRNTFMMDLTQPGIEQGNFYLLLSGMKKD